MTPTSGRPSADQVKPPAWRRALQAYASLPRELRFVLLLAVILHGCALSWGMPGSDAWDNDGIAPRDILPGLAETFTPGSYYTYPPLQLAILGVLTLPVTVAAVVRAGTTSVPAVVHEILAPSYMTAFTMTARVVCLLQSLGVILALASMAKELAGEDEARGRRAATLTALFATVGAPFTYYSHTSNLDVPYLFWGSLGALMIVRTLTRQDPRLLRRAALFAAMAAATKDQAYALFLFSAPAAIGAWLAFDPWARSNARRIAKESVISAGIVVGTLAVLDGAVFNPSGFRARLRFLSGPASQDFATYSKDLNGRIDNVLDIGHELMRHYPLASASFLVAGLVTCVAMGRRSGRRYVIASLLPLAIAISFTLGFNLTARRVEERFTLPHALLLAIYAGYGLELAWSAKNAVMRPIGRLAVGGVLAWGLYEAARVDATMLLEPRYKTEAYLEEHARDQTIEVHGLNVYLPRFPASAHVTRVGSGPTDHRNPLPGVTEVQDKLSDIGIRKPRFVVVSLCYAWRYLRRDMSAKSGRIYPTTQHEDASDADATAMFQSLFDQRDGYHIAQIAEIKGVPFEPYSIHGSLNCPTFTFERNGP
jgi:hypothetical protein